MLTNPRITVATVVPMDAKYIIVEESIDGQWVLNQPAGHVEENEDFCQAAVRETLEETGWSVAIQHLIGIYRWRVAEFNFIRFCFCAKAIQQIHPEPPDGQIKAVHRYSYQDLSQLPDHRLRSPMVLRCIEDHHQGHCIPVERLKFLNLELMQAERS